MALSAAMPDGEEKAALGRDELVKALQAGQSWAFEWLHENHLDQVFNYVLQRVGRLEVAEDITSDVFLAALQSSRSFRGAATPLTWLLGIARRKIADYRRQGRHRHEILEADLPEDAPSLPEQVDWNQELPEDYLSREDTKRAVRRAVARLPEDQRDALLMRHVQGLPIQDICVVMRRSEDAVKGLIYRAKSALLEALNGPLAK